ncbi:hypothetical protein [Herbaspirillum huttiense]|uniref:hypothetical protein n=1 Tax=Herbaspirillum huttiense TaxID=863372 RepID=UPI002176B435|nr:hypothetical protein [Herbaspirillum huttiense]UWE15160.1 hypothetical protein NY669_18945 [Herbaspirillum huttiense]
MANRPLRAGDFFGGVVDYEIAVPWSKILEKSVAYEYDVALSIALVDIAKCLISLDRVSSNNSPKQPGSECDNKLEHYMLHLPAMDKRF